MFDVYTLEIQGNIYNYISGDFTGDKLEDIALVYAPDEEPNNRYLGLFIQRREGGFGVRADKTVLLPPSAAQIDAGNIDNDQSDEIVVMDSEGVLVFHLPDDGSEADFVRLIRENTIYSVPLFQGIIAEPFLINMANFTGPAIVVPTPKGYIIYRRGVDSDYRPISHLTTPLSCRSIGRETRELTGPMHTGFSACLGSVQVSDGNRDGRPDLYFLWDSRLCCYYQNEIGGFSEKPDIDVEFYPAGTDGNIRSRLADVNGDSSLDVVASCTSGGITKAETKVRVYLSGVGGKIDSKCKKEISLSDSYGDLIVKDFNNDGRGEMVVPAVELGAIAAAKMLLMKKADLHLLIYPLIDGLPDNEPLIRPTFEFQLNFDNPDPTQEVTVNWSADYNGDGLADMVTSDGRGNLQFYWGKKEEFLSKKPDLKMALDHPAEIHPLHLNGGLFADLIIEHAGGGRSNRLTILRNRSNKI